MPSCTFSKSKPASALRFGGVYAGRSVPTNFLKYLDSTAQKETLQLKKNSARSKSILSLSAGEIWSMYRFNLTCFGSLDEDNERFVYASTDDRESDLERGLGV